MCRGVLRLCKLRMLFRKMSGRNFPSAGWSKYIAPKAEHLEKRVEEINSGAYDELIEQIMQKPITEMKELYNNREIEK